MEFLGKPETELASNAGKVNFEWIIGVGEQKIILLLLCGHPCPFDFK